MQTNNNAEKKTTSACDVVNSSKAYSEKSISEKLKTLKLFFVDKKEKVEIGNCLVYLFWEKITLLNI